MESKLRFSRVLAIGGTVLAWLPILAMIILAVSHLIRSGRFMADYLLPAELFLVVLAGAGLLLWAALRAKILVKPIAWGAVVLVAALLLSQGAAVVTGLASGEHEFTGWRMIVTLSLLILYELAVVYLGVIGITLISKLRLGEISE